MSEAQRFGLRFFVVLAAFSVFAWLVSLPDQLGAVQRSIAQAAGAVARLAGSTNHVHDDQIQAKDLSIHVNHECTGIYVLIILFTFLLSYPARWRRRLLGIVVGTAGLTAVNILRLSFLVRIAEIRPPLFEYFHEYVWQGVLLVLVVAYAMSWVEHGR